MIMKFKLYTRKNKTYNNWTIFKEKALKLNNWAIQNK